MDAPTALTCIGRICGPPEKVNNDSTVLDAWRESSYYTDRERAALPWTEAVTNIQQGHAPDEVFEKTRQHFSEKELVDLTLAIVAINGWNRLAISFRSVPGSYQPSKR